MTTKPQCTPQLPQDLALAKGACPDCGAQHADNTKCQYPVYEPTKTTEQDLAKGEWKVGPLRSAQDEWRISISTESSFIDLVFPGSQKSPIAIAKQICEAVNYKETQQQFLNRKHCEQLESLNSNLRAELAKANEEKERLREAIQSVVNGMVVWNALKDSPMRRLLDQLKAALEGK